MAPDKESSVGWGSLALINAAIAQSKQRSGVNWFIRPNSEKVAKLIREEQP
ncbi:hypothetical protein [Hymenobacter psychrotolerans]|uniref:Uncharacterized protein n=1 Tax=Hymenobacter psychrotolerans DSM 18569 TaxID=1121959 RepID=A0A1M7G989_9BACT|nr:hypothetical protein [Hymenobacter psychrotolerans]SHM12811.1 hypothetical protein SAMN02746009_03993 [Hymenobacter psychrotolerans DSM 18569]